MSRTAFFPGGTGIMEDTNCVSNKRIMVLGQDFGSEAGFERSKKEDSDKDILKNPTWRNILHLLDEVNINPKDCFFTNIILGIRKSCKATGKSPAFRDKDFIEDCRKYFLFQLDIQKPKAIFVLGKYVAQFLSTTSDKLIDWKHIDNYSKFDSSGQLVMRDVTFYNNHRCNLVVLTHPSLRPVNIRKRKYKGQIGHEAEIQMIADVLRG